MTDLTTRQFTSWGVCELMGHQRIAGWISEQTIGGAAMVRVDVPESKARPAYTKFFGPSAIYAITPTSEEVARFNVEQLESWSRPVPYEPPKQLAASSEPEHQGLDYEFADDDDDVSDYAAKEMERAGDLEMAREAGSDA